MNYFEFGAAKEQYALPRHPRLLIGEADIPALRAMTGEGDAARLRALLRDRAEHLSQTLSGLEEIQPDSPIIEPQLASKQLPGLDDMALAGVLDGTSEMIESARHLLLAAARYDAALPDSTLPSQKLAWGGGRHIAWAYDLIHGHLGDSDRRVISQWLWQVGIKEFLERCGSSGLESAGSNVQLLGLVSALFSLMAIAGDEEVPDITESRDQLIRLLKASVRSVLGPDGYPWEDIGYGTAVIALLAPLLDAVRRAGWWDAYEDSGRLRKFGHAMLQFVQPWGGSLSVTGDHGDGFADREFILARLAHLNNDPTLLWLSGTLEYPPQRLGQWSELRRFHPEMKLADGRNLPISGLSLLVWPWLKEPQTPLQADSPPRFIDHGRGIVSQRTGWNADDMLLVVDGSQRSSSVRGHDHESAGHFNLSAKGGYFAIDMGRYSVDRLHHNVVVPGESKEAHADWKMTNHHGRLIRNETGPHCDWVGIDASQQAGCHWSYRHIGMIRARGGPSYVWMMDDVNLDDGKSGKQPYQWLLHTSPENRITLDESSAIIEAWRGGNHLDVFFSTEADSGLQLSVREQRCGSSNYITPEILAQRLATYGDSPREMIHGPVFQCPLLTARTSGYRLRQLSVLVPRNRQSTRPRFRAMESIPNTLAFELEEDGYRDRFVWAIDHGLLIAPGIDAKGLWHWERQDMAGKVIAFQTVEQ